MDKVMLIILIFLLIITCLHIIKSRLEKAIVEENKALLNIIQCKNQENELLYRILRQVRNDLALLKLKDCPEEEYKNIPLELLEWLEELFRTKETTKCQDSKKDL